MPTYKFIGEASETFPYLPADPTSRVMEPGDTVDCTEEVSHARLELVTSKAKKSDTTPEEAN